jgi:hypothetical protein
MVSLNFVHHYLQMVIREQVSLFSRELSYVGSLLREFMLEKIQTKMSLNLHAVQFGL